MIEDSVLGELTGHALDGGASSAKRINAGDIMVNQWVRHKCLYGCGGYGRYFTCPPFSPSIEKTKQMIEEYGSALLFEFNFDPKSSKHPNITELMFELERKAFLSGLYKAFAFSAGPCRLCDSCVASSLENANRFSKRLCKHPSKARPSMESSGIDVFETARKAGYEIDVVKNQGDCYKRFGLLMLD